MQADRQEAKNLRLFSGVELLHKSEHKEAHVPGVVRVFSVGTFLKLVHYDGWEMVIDLMVRPGEELAQVQKGLGINPAAVAENYALRNGEVHWHLAPQEEQLFDSIDTYGRQGDLAYLRLKTLEVLLYLTRLTEERCERYPVAEDCTPRQATIARAIHAYLMRNMAEHVTIETLSGLFELSKTQLKESFKKYYGDSIFQHVRADKMKVAAHRLRTTDLSLQEIAAGCGYDSVGKFTKAFAATMEATPAAYRRQNANPHNLGVGLRAAADLGPVARGDKPEHEAGGVDTKNGECAV